MTLLRRFGWRSSIFTSFAFMLSLLLAFASSLPVFASAHIRPISSDPFTNNTSQHRTQVEPDTYSFGSTIVATFQSGRFFSGGGSSDIGWATSTNSGKIWTHGFLPGTTVYEGGPWDRGSDPVVAYDAKHKVWMISVLALNALPPFATAVLTSLSSDGGLTWSNPVTVHQSTDGEFLDKNWIVCDDTATSPFYGHCYTEWDDFGHTNRVQMSTSADGGKTWGSPKTTADQASVIGGQPLVQPNGTVIVPITVFKANFTIAVVGAFRSTDGGANWSSTVTISPLFVFFENASMRDGGGLVSAEIDGAGKVYVVWQDCRFEPNCIIKSGSANDIVMSTSTDGVTWTSVQRIPIDPVGSGVNHIIPGIGVDKHTSGSNAHLGLTFYYFPVAGCFTFNCQLDVGFLSSINGGASWSAKQQLAGPMNMSWLADTTGGFMVGDYISTSIVGNDAFSVFAVATPPTDGEHLNEAMYTVGDLIVGGPFASHGDAVTVSGMPHWTKPSPTAR
jgi:hypothetical protein